MPVRVPRSGISGQGINISPTPSPSYGAQQALGKEIAQTGAELGVIGRRVAGGIAEIEERNRVLAEKRQKAADIAAGDSAFYALKSQLDETHSNFLLKPNLDSGAWAKEWDQVAREATTLFLEGRELSEGAKARFVAQLSDDLVAYRSKVLAASNAHLFDTQKANLMSGEDVAKKDVADPRLPWTEAFRSVDKQLARIEESDLSPAVKQEYKQRAEKVLEGRLETLSRENPTAIVMMERASEGEPKAQREAYKRRLGSDRWSYYVDKADTEIRRIRDENVRLATQEREKLYRETKEKVEKEVTEFRSRISDPARKPSEEQWRQYVELVNGNAAPGAFYIDDTTFQRVIDEIRDVKERSSDDGVLLDANDKAYRTFPAISREQLTRARQAFLAGRPGLNNTDYVRLLNQVEGRQTAEANDRRDETRTKLRMYTNNTEQSLLEPFAINPLLPSSMDNTMKVIRSELRQEFTQNAPYFSGTGGYEETDALRGKLLQKYVPRLGRAFDKAIDALRQELKFPVGQGAEGLEKQIMLYKEAVKSGQVKASREEMAKLQDLWNMVQEKERIEFYSKRSQ